MAADTPPSSKQVTIPSEGHFAAHDERLLACPFCGGHAVVMRHAAGNADRSDYFYGNCMPCDAEGPPRETHDEALAAWNQRMSPVETTAVPALPMRMNEPWSLPEVLAKLIEATEHSLDVHSCDTHGYELFRAAANAGRSILREWQNSAVEPAGPRGKPCTCPDTSSTACGVERGQKLGELWYCRRAAEKEHLVKGLASAGSSAAVNPRDTVGGSAEPSGRSAEKANERRGTPSEEADWAEFGDCPRCWLCSAPVIAIPGCAPGCIRNCPPQPSNGDAPQ